MVQKQTAESSLEDLMERYFKGDSQACEGLLSYLEHQQRVERIARKNTRGTSVSWEDAAQNAHLRVFQAAINRRFRRGGVREFYLWAAAVAQNEIIDLVRREKRKQKQCSKSLDQLIPGTDMPLWEIIPDDYSLIDAVERADLVLKALEVIETIDQNYPSRCYLRLWKDRVQGKKQQQIAVEMGVSQGEISKRWKDLMERIAEDLGLLETEDVKRNLQTTRNERAVRSRSDARW
jgi:RNA polymerase sporulation-specific sigma factor